MNHYTMLFEYGKCTRDFWGNFCLYFIYVFYVKGHSSPLFCVGRDLQTLIIRIEKMLDLFRKCSRSDHWKPPSVWRLNQQLLKGAFVWEYSGIRMYSGIYSGYSAPGIRIARMESRYSGMRIAPKQTLTCIIPIILIPD